jgi:hypothetical protein
MPRIGTLTCKPRKMTTLSHYSISKIKRIIRRLRMTFKLRMHWKLRMEHTSSIRSCSRDCLISLTTAQWRERAVADRVGLLEVRVGRGSQGLTR